MKFKKKKILILTSLQSHHQIFLNKIRNEIDYMIIKEKLHISPKFNSEEKLFFKKQKSYEDQYLKKNKFLKLKPSCLSKNINEKKNILIAKKFNPDIIIVFGTRKLNISWINSFPKKMFNVHRGDPNYFRGLDSEFWSIYHGMYNGLAVCIHKIATKLDTGDIFSLMKIHLKKEMKLHQLRLIMTLKVVKIFKKLIKMKNIKLYKQSYKGRYYSTMPSSLKKICETKFNKKCKNLK